MYNEAKVDALSTANMVANVVSGYMIDDADEIQYVLKQLNISDGIRVVVSNVDASVIIESAEDVLIVPSGDIKSAMGVSYVFLQDESVPMLDVAEGVKIDIREF